MRIESFTRTIEIPSPFPAFEQCRRCYHWYDLDETDSSIPNKAGRKICPECREAKKRGYHVYQCDGCETEVSGAFKEVRSLLNVFGKAFCVDCRTGFFGPYNPLNPALNVLLGCLADKRKIRSSTVWKSEDQRNLHEEFCKYNNLVRRLSRKTYHDNIPFLNPHNRPFGPSGKQGAYHLDHIVPVSMCWEYYVLAEEAASIHNLQIIPWFVNVSRGNHFSLGRMIGWPIRNKKRSRY